MQERSGEPSVRTPYDLFAAVYDQFFAPDALDATLQVLDSLLLTSLGRGAEILDLCCGTGRLTEVLVGRGYQVTGVDNSCEMLDRARARVPQATFLQADIRQFQVQSKFDAVICAYNSLPHITVGEELTRTFQSVRRCLRPEGIFVFDLYSRSAYAERWRGSFARVDDEYACIVQARYDPVMARGENRITIFHRNGERKRADVKLVTRCYADEELRPMLAEAGFQSSRKFDDAVQMGSDVAGRVFWRCVGTL